MTSYKWTRGGFSGGRVYNASQCQAACQAHKKCNYFEWIDYDRPAGHNSNCHLMWKVEGKEICGNCVVGPKYCLDDGKASGNFQGVYLRY